MELMKIIQQLKQTVIISVLLFFATVVQGTDLISFALTTHYNSTSGLSSGTISTTATSYEPSFSSTYLQTKGWDAATDGGFKSYETTAFSTFGYHTVVVNASIYSQNTGVRDFAVEYKIGAAGTWTNAGNFAVGSIAANRAVTLPSVCNNKSSVAVRWIATSYISVSGGNVVSGARNYIYAVSISGDLPMIPDNQANTITFVSITPTTIRVSCTPGNGDNRIIVMNTSDSFTLPVDDYNPTANSTYSGGQQVVYNGSGSIITVTVPSSTNKYWFRVFDYKMNGGMTRYITSTASNNPKLCALETITPNAATNIRLTRATLGATISPKKSTILDRGIVWSLTSGDNFNNTNEYSDFGDQDGSYSLNFPDGDYGTTTFPRGTTIYYKGYVENISGKIYSAESSFNNTPIFSGTGNWENASLWNVKEVPGANGDATYGSVDDSPIINGTCTLTASNNVTNLTINSAKKLTINKAVVLKVDGTLTNNAGNTGILIKSRAVSDVDATGGLDPQYANGSLIFANGSPSGTVEMYSKANWNLSNAVNNKYKWQFFTIPVKTMTAGSTFNFSSCYVREWDESVTTDLGGIWQKRNDGSTLYLSGSTSMNNTNGYEVVQENPKVYTFSGALQNSDFTKTLSYNADAAYPGANIIGNPFTAAVDITKLTFGPNTEQTIYQYNTGTYTDWEVNKGNSTSTTNAIIAPGQYTATTMQTGGNLGIIGEIPPMQGFLVKTTMNNETFTIPRSALVTNTKQQRVKTSTASTNNKVATRVDVVGTRFSDCMWIFTDETCTRGFDNGWDARKIDDMPQVSQIYAMEVDGNYQINAVSDINESYLGFQSGEDTEFKLIFNHQNLEQHYSKLYLVDLVANFSIDISNNGSEYSFTSSPTDIVKRFKIISNPTGLNQNPLASKVSIYNNKNTIFINNTTDESGQVAIYNTLGHCLQVSTLEANKQNVLNTNLSLGAYIVKTTIGSEKVTQRIIVN